MGGDSSSFLGYVEGSAKFVEHFYDLGISNGEGTVSVGEERVDNLSYSPPQGVFCGFP